VLTIHQGNWEWMLHATTAALGIPMDPVYKPLHNASADRLMHAVRSRFGARPLPLKSAARDILRQREHFRLLVLVADQSPTRRERGLWTDFLHRPAAFHTGAETLARAAGFPVVFARCRRRRRGYYSLRFIPLAVAPRDEAQGAITRRYAAMAEQAIREEPASWLWSNRRWKRQPGDQPGDRHGGQ
jgi:KDO2-lipid IV(A) lauroyltransferase